MRHANGKNMAGDDGDHGGVPNEFGADDADIDAVVRRAEYVPANSEGIRGERDDELSGEQQVGKIVC